MGGTTGCEPVAMIKRLEEIFSPFTSTVLLSINLGLPNITLIPLSSNILTGWCVLTLFIISLTWDITLLVLYLVSPDEIPKLSSLFVNANAWADLSSALEGTHPYH